MNTMETNGLPKPIEPGVDHGLDRCVNVTDARPFRLGVVSGYFDFVFR